VAVSRGPAVIAREIRSRFLDYYLETFAEAVETIRRSQEWETARLKAQESLAAIVKVEASKGIYVNGDWVDETQPDQFKNRSFWVTVDVGSGSDAELKLTSAPIALVGRVLQVIQDYRKGEA
jgi:hypothetical protein